MPGFARLGDKAKAAIDAHGCTSCVHSVVGPAISGSKTVLINNKPALRLGDNGVHAACCGPNTWVIAGGSSTVMIDGKPAARVGDATQHCGGVGQIIDSSSDVMVGG